MEKISNDLNSLLDELQDIKNKSSGLENNLFNILGIQNLEIKHSNLLAYLFDKNKNGEIGTSLLEEILNTCNVQNTLTNCNILDIFKSKKFTEINVFRENNNIDILIDIKPFFTVIIENKIWADEHDKQLFNYSTSIRKELKEGKFKENIEKEPICIYLTPDGRSAKMESDNNWVSVSYKQIYLVLLGFKKSNTYSKLSGKQKYLISDYIDLLKGEIVMSNKKEIKEYWETFKSDKVKRNIIEDLIMYMPNYKKREKIIYDACNKNNIDILKESSTSYINICPRVLQSAYLEKGLGKNFIYMQISNNESSTPGITCWFDSSEEVNKLNMSKFFNEYYKHSGVEKNLKDPTKDRSLGHSIKFFDYQEYEKTEEEKQEDIIKTINNLNESQIVKDVLTILKDFNVTK